MVLNVRTQSKFSFKVRMKRSATPLPSGSIAYGSRPALRSCEPNWRTGIGASRSLLAFIGHSAVNLVLLVTTGSVDVTRTQPRWACRQRWGLRPSRRSTPCGGVTSRPHRCCVKRACPSTISQRAVPSIIAYRRWDKAGSSIAPRKRSRTPLSVFIWPRRPILVMRGSSSMSCPPRKTSAMLWRSLTAIPGSSTRLGV